MDEIFKVIEDISLPMLVVLLSDLFILAIFGVVVTRISAHSFKEISNSVDLLDECVKTIGDELDDVAEAIHDLKDHQ